VHLPGKAVLEVTHTCVMCDVKLTYSLFYAAVLSATLFVSVVCWCLITGKQKGIIKRSE